MNSIRLLFLAFLGQLLLMSWYMNTKVDDCMHTSTNDNLHENKLTNSNVNGFIGTNDKVADAATDIGTDFGSVSGDRANGGSDSANDGSESDNHGSDSSDSDSGSDSGSDSDTDSDGSGSVNGTVSGSVNGTVSGSLNGTVSGSLNGTVSGSGYLIKRKIFPQTKPEICIASLSCNRYELLNKVLLGLIQHMEETEPDVAYEVVVMNNGCVKEEEDSFREKVLMSFEFERYGKASVNLGIAAGLNSLFFGLCTAPFVMSIEDDWGFVGKGKYFKKALRIMTEHNAERDPKLVGLYMGHDAYCPNLSPPFEGADYRVVESGPGWCFSNGASLLKRSLLFDVGPQLMEVNIGETNYKDRVYLKGYRMGCMLGEDGQFDRGFEHRGEHIDEHTSVFKES